MFKSSIYQKSKLCNEVNVFKQFEVHSLFKGSTFKDEVVLIHGMHLIKDSANLKCTATLIQHLQCVFIDFYCLNSNFTFFFSIDGSFSIHL